MAVVAASVLAVPLLGSCTNPIAKLTTEHAVGDAIGADLKQPSISLQLSLGLTQAQLEQLAASRGGSGITAEEASALSRSSIYFDLETGHGEALNSKQGLHDPADQVELALQVASARPVDLRYTGRTLYLRADIAEVLSEFGQGNSAAGSFARALQQANQYVPGLGALGEGRWVSVPGSTLGGLYAQLRKAAAERGISASEGRAQSEKLIGALKSALSKNTTYTSLGTHGARTEYRLAITLRPLVEQVLSAYAGSLGSLPGAASLAPVLRSAANKVPSHLSAVLDLWVEGGRAEEVDLDLDQFIHHNRPPFPVPLRLVIGAGRGVAAPRSAAPLDFSRLGQILGQALNQAGAA